MALSQFLLRNSLNPLAQPRSGGKIIAPSASPGSGQKRAPSPGGATEKLVDKDLSPLPGLIKCNILSGGSRPRLLSFHPSGALPVHSATEFRDSNYLSVIRGSHHIPFPAVRTDTP
jgi:hypothetical protein